MNFGRVYPDSLEDGPFCPQCHMMMVHKVHDHGYRYLYCSLCDLSWPLYPDELL